jgi:hypothetical protein
VVVVVLGKKRQGIREDVAGQEDIDDEDDDEEEEKDGKQPSAFVFVLTGDWQGALMSLCVCTHISIQ